MKAILSAYKLIFSPVSFSAKKLTYTGDDEFKSLGTRYKDSWFLYRRSSQGSAHEVLALPLVGGGGDIEGEDIQLTASDNLSLLSALFKERLPKALPSLGLQYTRHGLFMVDRTRDLVAYALDKIRIPRPAQLRGFYKYKKTELEPRIISLRPGSAEVILVVGFGKHHEIVSSVQEIAQAGVDVRSLWAIDKAGSFGADLIGKIVSLNGEKAVFGSDARFRNHPASECLLEPSPEAFSKVLSQVLGGEKAAYDQAEWDGQATVLAAPSYLEELKSIKAQIGDYGPIKISRDLSVRLTDVVEVKNRDGHETVTSFGQIQFCFDSDRSRKHRYPSAGLMEYGPFDQDNFDKKTPRILVVGPVDVQGRVEAFVKEFREGLGTQGQRYANGFGGLYKLVNPVFTVISANISGSSSSSVGEKYRTAIESHFAQVSYNYDAAIVVLKDAYAFTEVNNPYLVSKAYLLGQGIPVQEVRLSKLGKSKYDLQFIYEDLSVALYAKLGGTPWTVMPAQTVAHEIVFGMGIAEVGERLGEKKRYVGTTTVFKSDGNYLLSAFTRQCRYEDYPETLRATVEEVLDALKREQDWRSGDTVRLVFHSFKPLRNTDIASIVESALRKMGTDILFEYAFLNIRESHPFLVMDLDQYGQEKWAEALSGQKTKGTIGQHVPSRGISIELGRYKRLLCVNGPELVRRHKEPLPRPLLIEMHPKSSFTDMTTLTRQVFYFTGLSWRSVRPSREPTTILYSSLITRLMNKLATVPNWSPDMLNTKLRRSRWFL